MDFQNQQNLSCDCCYGTQENTAHQISLNYYYLKIYESLNSTRKVEDKENEENGKLKNQYLQCDLCTCIFHL